MRSSADQAALEADLVAWGRVITLETTGRRSGSARRVSVGFVEEPDGALLVAAGAPSTSWACNLRAHPSCHVERSGVREPRRAVELDDQEHDRAVRSLILKYGTPSEVLGPGPAFRLERADALARRRAPS